MNVDIRSTAVVSGPDDLRGTMTNQILQYACSNHICHFKDWVTCVARRTSHRTILNPKAMPYWAIWIFLYRHIVSRRRKYRSHDCEPDLSKHSKMPPLFSQFKKKFYERTRFFLSIYLPHLLPLIPGQDSPSIRHKWFFRTKPFMVWLYSLTNYACPVA